MSAITDVGVNFKFQGGNDFEGRMKSMESQWKSFSESFNKTPPFAQHMEKMAASVEHASGRIVAASKLIKAALITVATAKGVSSGFSFMLGNEEVAKAKSYNEWVLGAQAKRYDSVMSEIRDKHNIGKADLFKGIYQIDSAMSGKPFEQSVETLKVIPYYMQLAGKSFEDASKMVKGFYASFGESLPLEKQKTYAKDTLGQLLEVARISKSDPQQVMESVGRLGSMYATLGMTQSQMFADVAGLTARLGGRVDVASTALLAIYPRAGEAAEKLEKARYEQAWAKGMAVDKLGRHSPNWGSLENLQEQAKLRNPMAMRSLSDMHAQSSIAGSDAARRAEQFIKDHDPAGMFNYLGELVDANKNNPRAMKVMKDAFGQEHINAMLAQIDLYKTRENQRLKQGFENPSGDSAMAQADEVNKKDLNHIWGLVKQGAEDFSASIRSIFYEPMRGLLEEWKLVFKNLEQQFSGAGGLQKLKEFSAAGTSGFLTGWHGGKPGAEDNRSVGQMFQEWISTIDTDTVNQSFQKIGKAATDFIEVMGQLKQIVNAAAKALGYISEGHAAGIIAGAEAARITPGPPIVKAGVGLGVGLAVDAFTGNPEENFLGIPGSHYMKKGLQNMVVGPESPDVMSSRESQRYFRPPPDQLQTNHENHYTFQPKNNIEVHVNLDGDEISQKVAPRIKEDLERDSDRNRGNSNDQPLMGTN